jgi:hypothetical protein
MNRFVKEYLMGKDGRNPYGSRGGYVYSKRPRRDYGEYNERYDGGNGYIGREYDNGYAYPDYPRQDYARDHVVDERGRQYYGYFGDMPFDVREHYMDRDYRNNSRYPGRRDYGENAMMNGILLTKEDFEEWKRKLKNSDGSHGEHFSKEQVEQVAKQMGIDINAFDNMVFCMTVNMLYSDYCKVFKKYGMDRLEVYIDLAHAFLKDEDFDGSPDEKLALYYHCIVAE